MNGDQIISQPPIVQASIIEPKRIEEVEIPRVINKEDTISVKRPVEANVSEVDRKKMRAEKFGIIVEADKIAKRAERFGTGEVADKASMEKIKTRAERFGVVSPIVQTAEEKDRIEKRKERFGNVKENNIHSLSSNSDIAKRQSRFGIVEQEKPKRNSNKKTQFNNNRRFNNNRGRF